MPDEPASTARLRHIGRTLRTIREREGKTQAAVRRKLDRSPASLSTIENGTLPLRPRDLKYILYEYGIPDPERANLVLLAEQERRTGWWNEFKDIASRADRDHASLEYHAAAIDTVEMQFVPGLLQTEDYARAIMRASLTESLLDNADRLVAFRMARQRILRSSDPPRLRFVIDEAALRRIRGGAKVMRAQLHRLLEESAADYVTVQVLPFAGTADPGVNVAFDLLEIGRPPILGIVLIDHLSGRLTLEDEADLVRYREAFARAAAVAQPETDSRTLINRIISEL
jgi:transcriptional regulator with XRE-family HTH domain